LYASLKYERGSDFLHLTMGVANLRGSPCPPLPLRSRMLTFDRDPKRVINVKSYDNIEDIQRFTEAKWGFGGKGVLFSVVDLRDGTKILCRRYKSDLEGRLFVFVYKEGETIPFVQNHHRNSKSWNYRSVEELMSVFPGAIKIEDPQNLPGSLGVSKKHDYYVIPEQ
jgi:hypothetical protein